MKHAISVSSQAFCAVALLMLSACGNSEPSNHARQGGLWDQVFSQAMSDNPGKSE